MKHPALTLRFLLAATLSTAISVSTLSAANGTWTNLSAGSWSNSANWAGGTIADGSGSTAFFNTLNISSDIALTLGGNRTIGIMTFGDTVPDNRNWLLSGDTLTLAGSPGITVNNLGTGTATINSILAGTEGLIKSGVNTLILSGLNTYTGSTAIRGGQVVLDYANGGRFITMSNLVFGDSSTSGMKGANAGGGIFTHKGSSGAASVQLGSLQINAGQTRIVVDSGASGVDTLEFTTGITRNLNGYLSLDLRSSAGGPDGVLRIATTAASLNTALGAGGTGIASGTAVGNAGMSVTDSGGTGFMTAVAIVPDVMYSIQRYTAYTNATTISGSEVANDFFNAANTNYKIEAQSTPLTLTTGTREFSSLLIDTSAASGSLNLGVTLTNQGNNISGIILSGANNYEISGASSLVSNNSGPAYFQLSAYGGGTLTVSSAINVSRLGVSGDGVVVLSNTSNVNSLDPLNAASANINLIDGGTLSISAAGNLGGADRSIAIDSGTLRTTQSGTLTLTGPIGTGKNVATFDVTQASGVLSLTGIISQNGSLVKTGAGTLQLSGANTYGGTTEVRAGTLRFGANNVIAAGRVWVNGGTLDLSTFSDSTGTVVLTGGSIIGSGTLTGTAYNFESGTASAILAGAVNLTKTSGGTVTLSGANTYTGVTTLTAGTLSVGTIGNGGVAGNLGQAASTATNIVFNGGTLQYTGATASSNRAFTINAGTTATLDVTTNNLSIAGATGAVTDGALTKTGAGTLTLTAANTYTGLTTVSAGTLAYGTNDVISSGAVTVNGATAILALGNNSDSVGTVTVAGGGSITGSGAGALTSTGTFEMQSGSVSAILAGNGAVNKTTVGSVTFSAANTYMGTTLVSGGTLILSGSGSIANSAVVDVQAGAILDTTLVTGGTYTYGTGQTVKGNGTIIGDTILQGTLAAGNSPGILSFDDDLTLTSSANSIFEIQNTGMVRGTDYDGVNVVSSLTYDGTLTLTMTTLISDGTYNLFDFGSIAGNFDTVAFSGGIYTGTFSHSGGFWTATDLGGSGQTFTFELASGNLTVIPEPSTTLLLTGALTALVIFRRRRA